jgi:hypothetical protein
MPTPTRATARGTTQPADEPSAPRTTRGQPSVQTPPSQDTARSSATQNWAVQQRERNLEARHEKDRILKQIEADKVARKARDTERKNAAIRENTSPAPQPRNLQASSTANSARIQIRLISGRTIRQTFPASATPAADLRPFIDDELAHDTEGARTPAYRLKLMGIPPEPTREIGLSEEQQSLAELGLLPSATLVVTPIHGATEAYSSGNGWGLLSLPVSIVGGAAGIAFGAVGAVGGVFSSVLGVGTGSPSEDQPPKEPAATNSGARVRTIAEMRAEADKEDQQLYNGNQLNFQSDDKDDDGDM